MPGAFRRPRPTGGVIYVFRSETREWKIELADDDREGDGGVTLPDLRRFELFAFDLCIVGRLVRLTGIVIPLFVRRHLAATQAFRFEPLVSATGA